MNSNYVLIASKQDPAGVTMTDYLKCSKGFRVVDDATGCNRNKIIRNNSDNPLSSPLYKNIKLHTVADSLLHLENLDQLYPDAKAFIFLSKHKSDSGISTLTCHCTGNFADDNRYGGNPRELAISYPSLQKGYLKAITAAKWRVPGYNITIEATHHGPTSLKKPLLFVELGSSEKHWTDKIAAAAICDSLLSVLTGKIEGCTQVGIALGGTHYPSKFNKLLLESDFGLAAVASKHNLDAIDESMLRQMITKSIEKVTHIVVDNKGLGGHKERIMRMAHKTGLEILRV